MRKKHFLISFIYVIAWLLYSDLSAHTIPHDLEQAYGRTYLPLFFFVKLLPFLGLGILAFNTTAEGRVIQIRWQFFAAMILGLVLGYQLHNDMTTSMINKVGLVLIGILLIFTKNTNNRFIERSFFIFGATLGFEYGRHFLHTEDYMWYYVLSLITGNLFFILLNNFRIIGNIKLQIPLQIFSIFLIITGIILVLLA